jgi:hypothetical protein
MSAAMLKEMMEDRAHIVSLTVGQYHQMIDAGILMSGDPFELLNGYIVRKDRSTAGEDPVTVGLGHSWVIQQLPRLNSKLKRFGCYLQIQLPITLPPLNEPEPDGAIVIGDALKWRDEHPGAHDTPCVIEAADSSLRLDRTTKLAIYAASGIGQYVIVNLPEHVIEVYTNPDRRKRSYGKPLIVGERGKVSLATGGKPLVIPAKTLLP